MNRQNQHHSREDQRRHGLDRCIWRCLCWSPISSSLVCLKTLSLNVQSLATICSQGCTDFSPFFLIFKWHIQVVTSRRAVARVSTLVAGGVRCELLYNCPALCPAASSWLWIPPHVLGGQPFSGVSSRKQPSGSAVTAIGRPKYFTHRSGFH